MLQLVVVFCICAVVMTDGERDDRFDDDIGGGGGNDDVGCGGGDGCERACSGFDGDDGGGPFL